MWVSELTGNCLSEESDIGGKVVVGKLFAKGATGCKSDLH